MSRNNFDSRCCWIFTQDVLAIEGGLYPIPLTLGFFVVPDDRFPCCSFHFHVWVIFWLIISPCLPFFRGYCSTAPNFGCLNCFLVKNVADFAGKIQKTTDFGESKTPLGGTLGETFKNHGRRAVGRRIVSGQHPLVQWIRHAPGSPKNVFDMGNESCHTRIPKTMF